MTKYIFCTGGVVSSLGKGVAAASIGRILKSRGLSVTVQKLDPYLNVDPGTMSPYEHGEVFVLEDGAETDLDLGAYERFIDENLSRASNLTSGQVYQEVINRERRGDYLGKTIQVIPHVTNQIKARINEVARHRQVDIVIVEVGGTVGDIESLPFLEALRQMRKDAGRNNTFYIHVTLLPHLQSTNELKTKPTQHSVRELRGIGIQPDMIMCRADMPVGNDLREKIALFCDVEREAVIPLTTADTIYEVPLTLEEEGVADFICHRLNIDCRAPDLSEWRRMVEHIKKPKPNSVTIGIVGKYVELEDAYISVYEALHHAATHQDCEVNIEWIPSENLERRRQIERLEQVDGIVVPGGFGERGIEGKIVAANFARTRQVPYLGLCLGMQVMVIELARHVFQSDTPNSTEFNPTTPYPVIDLMADQRDIAGLGGTMRLGSYPCHLREGTIAAQAYQTELVHERHRHRFEFKNEFREVLGEAGLIFSGLSPDDRLVEITELKDHPFMVGSQFHPEFRSRPTRPHPLFATFVKAAREQAQKSTKEQLMPVFEAQTPIS
ncbi:MAG TPA: CTP synthase [Anaerolineae bacterium]|nr:CTP synthase [Anaerolineae bacterium]MCB9109260.1 CTP synthase [Anaerolineales bacterium]HRV92977.1 CTP synthase [Anaerolineae bacterium]